jgi:succinate dehydrogenase / fumarate reductase iron-sulfur subunit
LAALPQGKIEAKRRFQSMVNQMDLEGFGSCPFTGACELACPQAISIVNIVTMNREYLRS